MTIELNGRTFEEKNRTHKLAKNESGQIEMDG